MASWTSSTPSGFPTIISWTGENSPGICRRARFPSWTWEAALAREGDALTIDDATGAGREAAAIARECGHEVTLFVNPENVLAGSTYSFAWLCLAIDRARIVAGSWRGCPFALRDSRGPAGAAPAGEAGTRGVAGRGGPERLGGELAEALQVEDRSIPEFFQTVDEAALRALARQGVRIGNHGWTHAAIPALPPAAVRAEIVRARRWIEENFAVEAGAYAVPYGKSLPPFPLAAEVCTHWLLHDNALPPGAPGRGGLQPGKIAALARGHESVFHFLTRSADPRQGGMQQSLVRVAGYLARLPGASVRIYTLNDDERTMPVRSGGGVRVVHLRAGRDFLAGPLLKAESFGGRRGRAPAAGVPGLPGRRPGRAGCPPRPPACRVFLLHLPDRILGPACRGPAGHPACRLDPRERLQPGFPIARQLRRHLPRGAAGRLGGRHQSGAGRFDPAPRPPDRRHHDPEFDFRPGRRPPLATLPPALGPPGLGLRLFVPRRAPTCSCGRWRTW